MSIISDIQKQSVRNLDRQFSPRLDVLDIADALDPLSRAVIDNPAPLPPRPTYGIDAAGLLAVAKATREAKREEFNMGHFCGTECCAIAHFCNTHQSDDLYADIDCETIIGLRSQPEIDDAFSAIGARFGISTAAAIRLFDPSEYPRYDEDGSYIGVGREEVAERIEQYVSEHLEQSECRACGEIFYVDPDKAAEAMYCPMCETKHRNAMVKGIVIGLHG